MDTSLLKDLLKPLINKDGYFETRIPSVFLFCSHVPLSRTPMVYDPCLCIIAQGRKVGYLGDREIPYNSGHYLVQTLPMPFECESFASPEEPVTGISVKIDPVQLAELVHETFPPFNASSENHRDLSPAINKENAPPKPMASVAIKGTMYEAVVRLVRALHDENTARIMGQGRVREVLFEALQDDQGPALRALVLNQGNYSRIAKVLHHLQASLADDHSVDQLAQMANMSVSTFHQHFKAVTRSSPRQYLKRIRLIKAQMLLNQDTMNVTQTAAAVGYRSVNQFSRDYKKTFGLPPLQERRSQVA